MTSSPYDRALYCQAWAQMMVEIWVEKAQALDIRDTGDFIESFMYDVRENARGEVDKIVHVYNYYGSMVDMGVGNGVKLDEVEGSNRHPKEWKGDSYWRSVKVLTEKMAQMYGYDFVGRIYENLNFSEAQIR